MDEEDDNEEDGEERMNEEDEDEEDGEEKMNEEDEDEDDERVDGMAGEEGRLE